MYIPEYDGGIRYNSGRYQAPERQETNVGRRVRGPGEFPRNRRGQSNNDGRCRQETVYRLRG